MAQIINATRKTYESIRKHYNIAVENGRTGFSIWGNYMSLQKAEMVMNMIEMSLDLPKGYIQSKLTMNKRKRGMPIFIYEKPIPKEKMMPFDYVGGWDRDYFDKQNEFFEGNRRLKSLWSEN